MFTLQKEEEGLLPSGFLARATYFHEGNIWQMEFIKAEFIKADEKL